MTMFSNIAERTTLRDKTAAQTHARTFIIDKHTNKGYNSRPNEQTTKQPRTHFINDKHHMLYYLNNIDALTELAILHVIKF